MRSLVWLLGFCATSVVAVAPAGALAQEPRDERPPTKADMPGSVHKRLSRLVGSWDVAIQYKLGEKLRQGTATCDAKWILDGRFIQQDYQSQFQGSPFHVVQLLGYDAPRGKTIEVKLDNLSTGIMHNEGSISGDGKVITNEGESVDPSTGKPYRLRTVTTIVDPDHFTLEWFRLEDGKKADKVVTMAHTRKKS
jgi:hypothetical protein